MWLMLQSAERALLWWLREAKKAEREAEKAAKKEQREQEKLARRRETGAVCWAFTNRISII